MLLRARLPLVLLNCLMLIGVAVLAQWTAGGAAACVAVLLAATCPTWLAHATLVTSCSRCCSSRRWVISCLFRCASALGVRYVLPVLPFLFIAAGSGATR